MPENVETLAYRVGRVESRQDHLDDKKADKEIVYNIADELHGLRKVVIQGVLAVCTSAVVATVTMLYAVSQHAIGH